MNLTKTIARMKSEIRNDAENGIIPRDIAGFSHLHDFVDANEYGGFCEGDYDSMRDDDGINAAQNAIDAWIKSGALREVQS